MGDQWIGTLHLRGKGKYEFENNPEYKPPKKPVSIDFGFKGSKPTGANLPKRIAQPRYSKFYGAATAGKDSTGL
jgi:hypothetical protein